LVVSAPSPIYLGCYARNGEAGRELSYEGDRRLLLFGPTGSGKSTRIFIPNLLRLRQRSLVVIDPKGELARETAAHRYAMGEVVILNPFNVLGMGSSGFNPLASLNPDADTFVDDAMGLGEALIKVDEGKDAHWSESARNLMTALSMWEIVEARREGRMPLLENLRATLTSPDLAKADRQSSWMLSRPMRGDLARDGVNFADLKRRPITVYVILPAERLETHSVWLRLVIVSALRSLFRPGGIPTTFMLDEFAQLGHLKPIETAFGLVRGFGVQVWPVLQDLNQLKAIYDKRWETFIGNAGVVQGFAPNDMTTAEWMSQRAGDGSPVALGFNQGGSTGAKGESASDGFSYQQVKRRLLLPQDLMNLPAGHGVLWPNGTAKTIPFVARGHWER
jgi:type IV secretion system protein VirD4